jgi:hypothetical protein
LVNRESALWKDLIAFWASATSASSRAGAVNAGPPEATRRAVAIVVQMLCFIEYFCWLIISIVAVACLLPQSTSPQETAGIGTQARTLLERRWFVRTTLRGALACRDAKERTRTTKSLNWNSFIGTNNRFGWWSE